MTELLRMIADIFNRPQRNPSWFIGRQFSGFPGKKKREIQQIKRD